jgi:hypothetical protein
MLRARGSVCGSKGQECLGWYFCRRSQCRYCKRYRKALEVHRGKEDPDYVPSKGSLVTTGAYDEVAANLEIAEAKQRARSVGRGTVHHMGFDNQGSHMLAGKPRIFDQVVRPTAALVTDPPNTTTNAIPPRIAADASSKRSVGGSPSNATPPSAAITGTHNCTVAAVVARSHGSAVYQMA